MHVESWWKSFDKDAGTVAIIAIFIGLVVFGIAVASGASDPPITPWGTILSWAFGLTLFGVVLVLVSRRREIQGIRNELKETEENRQTWIVKDEMNTAFIKEYVVIADIERHMGELQDAYWDQLGEVVRYTRENVPRDETPDAVSVYGAGYAKRVAIANLALEKLRDVHKLTVAMDHVVECELPPLDVYVESSVTPKVEKKKTDTGDPV